METIRRLQFGISLLYMIYISLIYLVSSYFELRTCSLAETHHVRQNIIMLVVGLIPICAVAKQSRPTTKNGCLRGLCRPFCLQPRYYGLPSLLKFDGPTSPGANYEKYDFSENRKVQNPPGWWVFLLTVYQWAFRPSGRNESSVPWIGNL